eukprot:7023149-Lingulodinium_polyedra.AAC.1
MTPAGVEASEESERGERQRCGAGHTPAHAAFDIGGRRALAVLTLQAAVRSWLARAQGGTAGAGEGEGEARPESSEASAELEAPPPAQRDVSFSAFVPSAAEAAFAGARAAAVLRLQRAW